MKKINVPSCFGRDGNTPCLMAFCSSYPLCHECYLEYWKQKQSGYNSKPINEIIEKFIEENNLRLDERRDNSMFRDNHQRKNTRNRGK